MSVLCACADGRTGAQICQPDRTYGACLCATPDSGAMEPEVGPIVDVPADLSDDRAADVAAEPASDGGIDVLRDASTDDVLRDASTDDVLRDASTDDVLRDASTDVSIDVSMDAAGDLPPVFDAPRDIAADVPVMADLPVDVPSAGDRCEPGYTRCGPGGRRQTCNAAGDGFTDAPCPTSYVCRDGRCLPTICTPGAVFCTADGARQTCDDDGLGYTVSPCPTGQSCDVSVCRPWVCTPLQSRCVTSSTARACSGDGRSFTDSSCAPGDSCVDMFCRSLSCAPGAAMCLSPTSRRFCGGSGRYVSESCPFMSVCLAGQCVPRVCEPDAVVCDGAGRLRTCDADGLRETVRACGAGEACRAGACRPARCAPGEGTCLDATTLRTCLYDGLGAVDTRCVAPAHGSAPVCASGRCSFACDPGFVALGSGCVSPQPPRPLSPRVDTMVGLTTRFRWIAPAGVDAVRVEVCLDRACASVVRTLDATGSTGVLASPLPRGRFFWRVRTRVGSTLGAASVTWPFQAMLAGSSQGVSDANADGRADVAIGLSSYNRVRVFYGTATGLETFPAVELSPPSSGSWTDFGARLAWLGGFTEDDGSDLLVGAPDSSLTVILAHSGTRYPPLPTIGLSSALGVGSTVSLTGDVNADGFADAIIGVGNTPSGLQTKALLLFGGPEAARPIAATEIRSTIDGGGRVVGMGDVNGDGFADLAVAHVLLRVVEVYYGSARGIDASPSLTFPSMGLYFGSALARLGDINGDGYPEFAIGAPRDSDTPDVFVFRGGPSGLSTTPWFTYSGSTLERYGEEVNAGGDVNGDGYGDMLVRGQTQSLVFFGGSTGFSTGAMQTLDNRALFQTFQGVGDVNGDGFDDAVGGSSGLAYLFLGSATGLSSTASQTLRDASDSNFGGAVAAGY